jgi:type II secretion system protein D
LTSSVNTLRLGLDMNAEREREPASRGKWLWTAIVLLLPMLSACGTSYLEQSKDEPQGADDVVRSADLKPRFAQPTRESSASPPQPRGFSFFGLGTPSPEPVQAAEGVHPDAEGGGGYTLNFEDSPVANVANAVLGDILGVGYVIDPRAQGTITLSSGRPIDRKDTLFVLENALKANNLLLIRDNEGYRIVAGNDGSVGSTDRGGGSNSAEPGYGLTVMPLRYVSGETLSRLLEGFAARPGAIRTDPSGRILLVLGTGSERQAALDTVRSFDVDWMHGQSVGMYPVRNSDPQPIVTELEKIMDSGDAGLGHGLVKFQSVASSNAILVVAAKPELLRTAAKWIARLDSASTGSAGVEVYKVRYGDAKQIAQTLNDIFLRGANVSADSATNQIAPGSGSTALSATERLTGGKPNGGSDSNGSGSGGAPAASVQTASAAPFGGLPSAAVFGNAYAPATGGQGAVLPGVRITADISNNSVVIYANAEDYRIIERTLNQLDRPKLQVAIEVTIAEVTLNDQLDYGVQFFLSNGAISNTLTGQIPTVANNILANPAGPGLTGGLQFGSRQPVGPARCHQCAASTDRRQDPIQPFARRCRQRRSDARGGRSGPDFDRQRDRPQREQCRRQYGRLQEHWNHIARAAARELQRLGLARHRPGDQQRTAEQHEPDPNHFPTQGQKRDICRQRPDSAARRIDQRSAGENASRRTDTQPASVCGRGVRHDWDIGRAHRTYYLHTTANHSGWSGRGEDRRRASLENARRQGAGAHAARDA